MTFLIEECHYRSRWRSSSHFFSCERSTWDINVGLHV